MAYPTGSGSEILRRGVISPQANSATAFKFDGTSPSVGTATYTVPALHIITMISIIICEKSSSVQNFTLYAHDGTTQSNIIESQVLNSNETFVFSDKFCLIGGDWLKINGDSGSNFQIIYTYIDQNWEN